MLQTTFAAPDLTTFCRLDELGLEAVGQRLEPDRAVIECRLIDSDPWCRKCGAEGVVRDTVVRRLAHEPFPAILGSLSLGILAIIARIGNALKGPLPPALRTPIPTPMGDLGAAARLAWAMDSVLLTALAGASTALVFQSPVLLVAVSIALTGLTFHRWRHRI